LNSYYIRYNTKHGESGLIWRVFENGVEHLVEQIDIRVPVYGEKTIEYGIDKWNIACKGRMRIVNKVAIIE